MYRMTLMLARLFFDSRSVDKLTSRQVDELLALLIKGYFEINIF